MRVFYNEWATYEPISSSLTTKLEKSNLTEASLTSFSDNHSIRSTLSTKLEGPEISPDDFASVSFSHHYEIILKIKDIASRGYYLQNAARQYWSIRHLRTELENQSHLKEEKLPNNFDATLPGTLSNRALRAFKDQYLLDFVNVEDADEQLDERVLEQEIMQNIKKFLMSLGSEFAFIGNQYLLKIGGDEYYTESHTRC